MAYTIFHHQHAYNYHEAATKPSALLRFLNWAESEDKINHIIWVGISITVTSAVLFPLTMAIVLLNGPSFGLIIAAMTSFTFVVVTNLAAMPTKYTIPFLFLGGFIDMIIIACSFFI